MNYKKIILISILLLVLSLTAVSAADFNETYEDTSLADDTYSLESQSSENMDLNSAASLNELKGMINDASAGAVLVLSKDYHVNSDSEVISINKDLTIDGNGFTINGLYTNTHAIFTSDKGSITLKNLNMVNCHNDMNYKGSAIFISGSAHYTIENCNFSGNWADDYGGAIYYDSTNSLTIRNCSFTSNKADDDGGAIYSNGDLIIENCVFEGNSANDDGGAIYCDEKGKLTVKNSEFKSNFADDSGGAIYSERLGLVIEDCIFDNNFADESGGAVYTSDLKNPFEIRNCRFISNRADDSEGGAVFTYGGGLIVENSVFEKNTADNGGGAIYCYKNMAVDNCSFYSNSASGEPIIDCFGGAIWCYGNVIINNCIFDGNYAEDYGGAVHAIGSVYINSNQENLNRYTSFFINNRAGDNSGGAVYSQGHIIAHNTEFRNNSAHTDGGALFVRGSVNIMNCLFSQNVASDETYSLDKLEGQSPSDMLMLFGSGGAICSGMATIDNCSFDGNHALKEGGAIYASSVSLLSTPSYFKNNIAHYYQGGAIYTKKFNDNVMNATFINNKAAIDAGKREFLHSSDDGGAIYIADDNNVTFSHCAFIDNHCTDEGGAIYLDSTLSSLSLINNIFINNVADTEGSAVFNKGSYSTIKNNWWGEDSIIFDGV